jgi:putative transposase
MIDSFWSRMQVELLNRMEHTDRTGHSDFRVHRGLYKRQRRHFSLGMLTPIEFELQSTPTKAA